MENPEFHQGGYYNSQFAHEKRVPVLDAKNADHFIEDLLNLPNDDGMVVPADGILDSTGTTTDSSSTANTVVDTSCNSSSFSATTTHESHYSNFPGEDFIGCGNLSSSDPQFSSELCVPYDDLAELEWLSNFVEDSFSTEDLQKLQLISGIKKSPNNNEPSPETHHNDNEFHMPEPNHHRVSGGVTAVTHYHHPTMFRPETAVPAKARSKRSRAAPCNWTSRLLVVSPSPATSTATAATTTTTTTSTMSSSSDQSDIVTSSVGGGGGKKTAAKSNPKKKDGWENTSMAINGGGGGGEGRKCLHCATDKTPQWRTGPMGPKTLCNACGVRYKSGRLVPEYRPAASPTFVLTKHSNSHRKVLELRRQKEMIRAQTQQQQHQQQFLHQRMMFDVSNGDDYLIHQHIGPDFRQLI